MKSSADEVILSIPGFESFLIHMAVAAGILLLGWFVSVYVGRIVVRVARRSSRIDPTIVPMARTVTVWGIRLLVFIAALAQLGIQTTSVIAVIGAAGLAIGLALQGTLQNIAAGIMLLALRPLRVGESVNIVSKAEGKVDEIGLFLTRIQQNDGTYITLPNSLVWGNPIINYSRNQSRRIEFSTQLLYIHHVEEAVCQIEKLLQKHTLVLDRPAPDVSVVDYGDFRVALRIRAWVRAADFVAVQKALQYQVMQEVRGAYLDGGSGAR